MSETHPFTIDSFYKFIDEGKLMAAKCNKCGTLHLPPRPACTNCFSNDLQWVPVNNHGKLLTYTVIHVSPKQFEPLTPYPIGIVKLENGPQLLGMIMHTTQEQLKIGMNLTVEHERPASPQKWPTWPRFHFKPE
jgi:uncharacterized OB-fold protein